MMHSSGISIGLDYDTLHIGLDPLQTLESVWQFIQTEYSDEAFEEYFSDYSENEKIVIHFEGLRGCGLPPMKL